MKTHGVVDRLPRILAVQAEGAAPLARTFARGDERIEPVEASTLADSINVGAPRNGIKALRAVRASGGAIVTARDEAILSWIPRLARATGVFAEPTGVAALAGLEAALEKGLVRRGERVLHVATGNGLKDTRGAMRSVGPPTRIPPDLDAVRRDTGEDDDPRTHLRRDARPRPAPRGAPQARAGRRRATRRSTPSTSSTSRGTTTTGRVRALRLPEALTGVEAPIVLLYAKDFPTGAHKVGATYSVLMEHQLAGDVVPGTSTLVWPSTGNYGIGGAWVGPRMGYESRRDPPRGDERRALREDRGVRRARDQDAGLREQRQGDLRRVQAARGGAAASPS